MSPSLRRGLAVLLLAVPAMGQQHWPQFRGARAQGIAEGFATPASWDVSKGKNVLWKTPVPGLAHSSPVVWGDRMFVTTTVR